MVNRFGWVAAGLLSAMIAAPAVLAAPLLSADVQITSLPAIFAAYSQAGATPPASQNDTSSNCGFLQDCSYAFSLTSTGFTFDAVCDADSCDIPAFTVTLTNMVFQSGEILTGASLQEDPNVVDSDPVPPAFGTLGFTKNSVTLSIVALSVSCFGNLLETVSFQTAADTTENGIPEPSTLSLLGLGALGVAWWRRGRRRGA